jgi:hypothetical protein
VWGKTVLPAAKMPAQEIDLRKKERLGFRVNSSIDGFMIDKDPLVSNVRRLNISMLRNFY